MIFYYILSAVILAAGGFSWFTQSRGLSIEAKDELVRATLARLR